jgi:hypothetical protein
VVRGKAHPLRYELASPDASSRRGSSRSPQRWSETLRMPTPRAAWLEEPLSVEPDLSRPSSLLEAPPVRVRFRTAASRATHRLSPIGDHSTSENQAPTSRRGLGVGEAWAGRVPSCRSDERSRALRETEDLGVTPRAPPLTPVHDAPSPSSNRLAADGSPRGNPLAHLSVSTRNVTFAWELSSLDPSVARLRLATFADRRTRDAYDRCLPNPSNGFRAP